MFFKALIKITVNKIKTYNILTNIKIYVLFLLLNDLINYIKIIS